VLCNQDAQYLRYAQWLRNMAINLIRRAWPADFLPDAWSRLSVDPRIALCWLHFSLKN